MNIASSLSIPLRAPAETLGALDGTTAARLAEAAGEIVLILDRDGTILDSALASNDLGLDDFETWIGRKWLDTVTVESRPKIAAIIDAAGNRHVARWRQVNHPAGSGEVPVRYWVVPTGDNGRLIAIGRDLRATAALQQRLLEVQQSLERDYLRLRQAEARYRVLFEQSGEAMLVVDAATRRIREVNPAAARTLTVDAATVVGKPVGVIAADDARDAVIAHLGAAAVADQPPMRLALANGGHTAFSASIFRQDQASYFLVRLGGETATGGEHDAAMLDLLARMPDAFVLADARLAIVAANPAFCDAVHAGSLGRLRGEPLTAFIGRASIDLELIVAQVREHGAARNVATLLRTADDAYEDVELSAVAAVGPEGECFGFTIRAVARRAGAIATPERDLPRSVEQLTGLVGRVSLKEIVRESTDLIERLCIEAALAYTADNRASAAEVLGLSRQSLYSKMHRHGLGNLTGDAE